MRHSPQTEELPVTVDGKTTLLVLLYLVCVSFLCPSTPYASSFAVFTHSCCLGETTTCLPVNADIKRFFLVFLFIPLKKQHLLIGILEILTYQCVWGLYDQCWKVPSLPSGGSPLTSFPLTLLVWKSFDRIGSDVKCPHEGLIGKIRYIGGGEGERESILGV